MSSEPKSPETTATDQAPPSTNAIETSPETLSKLKSQLEFYFSDANLKSDKFLLQKLSQSEFIPLSVMLAFQKLKKIDPQVSVTSLQEAVKLSEILELSDDLKSLKRKIKFDPLSFSSVKYLVSNVPLTKTLDEILEYFEKYKPLIVKMQQTKKVFTGKVVLEFQETVDFEKLEMDGVELEVVKMEINEKAKREKQHQNKARNKRQKTANQDNEKTSGNETNETVLVQQSDDVTDKIIEEAKVSPNPHAVEE